MSGRFEGKVALVTGAARGIGLEISRRLAEGGASVVAADVKFEDAAQRPLHTSAGANRPAMDDSGGAPVGQGVVHLVMDVSDDASVETGVAAVLKAYARIDLLVNNAGITRDNLLIRMKKEEWDQVIGTNLAGTYRLCRAVLPVMVRARYGRVVNVSSVVARLGNAGQANYAAAKAGVEGLTRTLAREFASRNITVNCVAPGFIDTAMTRALGDEARSKLLELVPMKRLGTPEDVASAVLFLLDEGASYVTGTVLDVNGGMYM